MTLTKIGGFTSTNGAEIAAFDPTSQRLFVVAGDVIEIINLSNPANPTLVGTLTAGPAPGGFGLVPNSVAVGKPGTVSAGIVAVAFAVRSTDGLNTQANGQIQFFNASTGALLNTVAVGSLPDMVTFTPDGTKVLTANEGEPNEDYTIDPEGSISIIDLAGGVAGATVQTATFTAFNGQKAALAASGVRFPGPPATTVAQDLEPEYIAFSGDGTTAWVTLQENNAIAVVNIATATVTNILPLGFKDHSLPGNGLDASDRDVNGTAAGGGRVNIQNWPIFGMYQPDAIASYQVAGMTYYVTANEGDARLRPSGDGILPAPNNSEGALFNEESRVGAGSYILDPTVFPNAADLKLPQNLGRLTVTNRTGDIDGDGDFDQIYAYGARSFSIWDSTGNLVFDSGDQLERILATLYPANLDDGRSDNKGPEPEGVTITQVNGRTYAFIGLERSNGVMVYDVTNPVAPQFVQFQPGNGDVSPEGLLFIPAADSPNGQDLLITSNEVSKTIGVSTFAPPAFTLQLLHYYGESGLLGVETAPIMGALIDRFDDQYANTLVLAEGDSYIPGPWLIGGADPSLSAVPGIGSTALGRPDIAIMNAFGTDVSALGNHEFDLGSPVLQAAITASGSWVGAQFPFITANLDFSADSSLRGLADASLGGNAANSFAGQEANTLKGKIAPYTVITQNGEKIGVVGLTTFDLLTKTSPNGTVPKDDGNPATDDLQEAAAFVQAAVNALTAQGVNKIVMVDQLDTLDRNKALAPLVSGIDVMIAGGGHERMGDVTDTPVGFNGHTADFIPDAYPIVTAGADGKPTLIVTTDTEYTYLGRLVVDFDANGEIIVSNLNPVINGAYASTEATLQTAYNTKDTAAQIIASSPIGSGVKQITDAIGTVISAKDGTIWGYTNVYLEGDRAFGRTQEVNLGDITADANLYAAQNALGSGFITSLKNGGGIRASIGSIAENGSKIAPIANPLANKPAGAISTLDIENALRFDNKLMVFDTTPQGLKNILEYAAGLSSGPSQQNGGYAQIGGIRFSYDPDNATGSKVESIALIDLDGNITASVYGDGAFSPGAPSTISMVILNFTANGGDGYPIKANGENFRYLLDNGTVSGPVDEALDFTAAANVPSNALGEQRAFESYLQTFYATPQTAFDMADTPASQDQRIQNLNFRQDTVLTGLVGFNSNNDEAEKGIIALLGSLALNVQISTINTSFVNELIIFKVEDANGSVRDASGNLITPGTAGFSQELYLKAILNAATTESILSTLDSSDSLPNGFQPGGRQRSLDRDAGRVGFLFAVDTSLDALRVNPTGKTVRISTLGGAQITNLTQSGLTIAFSDDNNGSFDDVVVTVGAGAKDTLLNTAAEFPKIGRSVQIGTTAVEAIDLTGTAFQFDFNNDGIADTLTGRTISVQATLFREAAFNNLVGFYRVDPTDGSVINATGTDTNSLPTAGNRQAYAQAAFNNRVGQVSAPTNNSTGTSTFSFAAGSLLLPFLISNASTPNADFSNIYFPFLAVNSDGADHIRLLGDGIFGFEDLPGGGDQDFDDIIVQVTNASLA